MLFRGNETMRKITDRGDYIEIELSGKQNPEYVKLLFQELKHSFPDCEGVPLLVIDRGTGYAGEGMSILVENLKHGLQELKTRMAMVTPEDLQYGVSRIASAWTSNGEQEPLCMPFRNREEALAWLRGDHE